MWDVTAVGPIGHASGCRDPSPAAPASQSVSNASHMKVAQKPRGTARFRRYELVSVCGIRQWRRHSCLLSQRAFFGVSFLPCALLSVKTLALQVSGLLFCAGRRALSHLE